MITVCALTLPVAREFSAVENAIKVYCRQSVVGVCHDSWCGGCTVDKIPAIAA